MPAYVYRDDLRQHIAPLLELVGVTAEQLVSLRITAHGIEVDYRKPGADVFEALDFTFVSIADRHVEQELASAPAEAAE